MKRFFCISLLFTFLTTIISCTKEKDVYLFSYFVDNGEDGLHLAYSYDGLKWDKLQNGKSFLKPEIGKDKLMRDPSIVQSKDGTFHMVWTTGWWDQTIGVSSSKDLIEWTEQRCIPVMTHEPTTRNTWAPEVFYDGKDDLYYIIWASTVPDKHSAVEASESEQGSNHRQYYVTTRDFTDFSETKMFFDPDFSVIDGAIVEFKDLYWFILKNENSAPAEKNLRTTYTKNLKDGFPTNVSDNISGNDWAEGPSPLVLGEYLYVYFDKYMAGKYGGIRSKDGKVWEDVSETISFPEGVRHGTAFKVKESVLNLLLEQK